MKTIEEIRKQFAPFTKGGLEYHISEEFEGLLFGRWKPNNGPWSSVHWLSDGTAVNPCIQVLNLTRVQPPELVIQWEKLPEWVDWFAIDEDGEAYAYDIDPYQKHTWWSVENIGHSCFVPQRYYRNSGIPWDKSLRCRPGSEVKP